MALPASGDWVATLSGYGDVHYFSFAAQANRTLSISVTALDESGAGSEVKARPVIGMWNASDAEGTSPPAFTPSSFNTPTNGLTRLDASLLNSTNFLIGIADVRGDGRPDYRYHAHVLYGDSVVPARVGVNGGAVSLRGMGFGSGLNAAVGSTSATVLTSSATEMMISVPALGDGVQNITVSDPVGGGSTTMTGVLAYGAAADDTIVMVSRSNPSTPVGTQAANPISVRVVAADGVTAVSGATVGWSATNGVQLSACGGASSCSVITDQGGSAATWVTPGAAGSSLITATLAPGVYTPAQSVSAALSATQSVSDIGITTPYLYVSQGARINVPVTARVISNGSVVSNARVNFAVMSGTASLSAQCAETNASGYASVTLSIPAISALVKVSACVAPGNAPCSLLSANPVGQQILQQVSGAGQLSTGQVSASGGAGYEFGVAAESGDGGAGEFLDYRVAWWWDDHGDGIGRHEFGKYRHACDLASHAE